VSAHGLKFNAVIWTDSIENVLTTYCDGRSLHGWTVPGSGYGSFRVSIREDIQAAHHSSLWSNTSRLLYTNGFYVGHALILCHS